jgi:hypothetical protein
MTLVAMALLTPGADAAPRSCGELIFDQARPEDSFYDVRVRGVTCRGARRILTRFRYADGRCIPRWRCTYAVRVSWAEGDLRVRLAQPSKRIWFGIIE